MNIKSALCGLVALASIELTSCGDEGPRDFDNAITVYGLPISATQNISQQGGYSQFVGVFEIDGKKVLTYSIPSGRGNTAEAEALVLSEISDSDTGSVELFGHYIDNEYNLNKETELEILFLGANGHNVNFERSKYQLIVR